MPERTRAAGRNIVVCKVTCNSATKRIGQPTDWLGVRALPTSSTKTFRAVFTSLTRQSKSNRDVAFAAEIDAGHCPTLAREPEQAGGTERHRIGVVLVHVPDDVRFASGELAVGPNVEYDLLNGTSRPMVPSNNSEARQSEFLTDDNPWGYHTALWENFKGLDIHLTPCFKWSER